MDGQYLKLKDLRRQFGPGQGGRTAFRLIAKGAQCQAIVSEYNRTPAERCNQPAVCTVDVDIFGVTEFIPCCLRHEQEVGERLIQEAKQRGWFIPALGRNGWGRP